MNIPSRVQLIDVGPRDGLQNEKQPVPAAVKIELVHRLQAAGLNEIEVTSFVSPKWVPQMADNAEVMVGIQRQAGVLYSVLTPNMVGYQAAVASRPNEIVVFGAASQAFSQKNINCSIEESMERFAPVVQAALAAGMAVRGAMSCSVGCPYEGDVPAANAACTTGAKRSMLSAIEQLMFLWLKASLAAPKTTISSGLDFKAASKPCTLGVSTE